MKHRETRGHRGFRRDEAATVAARFEDYRSFVSQPKRIPNGCPNEVHLVLFGADKAPIRAEIFRRNREENGGEWRCWKCKVRLNERVEDGSNKWVAVGQWHHVCNKPGFRCDCPENGAVSCLDCHKPEHPQVRFGERTADQEKVGAAEKSLA